MRHWKPLLAGSAATAVLLLGASTLAPAAIAQARAALVRNVDEPALQPFRSTTEISFVFGNEQRLLTTVPAGKRLVIDHIAWQSFAGNGGGVVFGGLRNAQFGSFVEAIKINPPHFSADPSFILQDGEQSGPAYFEPGEQVWLSMTAVGINRSATVMVHGHYITL